MVEYILHKMTMSQKIIPIRPTSRIFHILLIFWLYFPFSISPGYSSGLYHGAATPVQRIACIGNSVTYGYGLMDR